MYKKIDFKSYPYLDRSSINLVSKLLKKKTLSNYAQMYISLILITPIFH